MPNVRRRLKSQRQSSLPGPLKGDPTQQRFVAHGFWQLMHSGCTTARVFDLRFEMVQVSMLDHIRVLCKESQKRRNSATSNKGTSCGRKLCVSPCVLSASLTKSAFRTHPSGWRTEGSRSAPIPPAVPPQTTLDASFRNKPAALICSITFCNRLRRNACHNLGGTGVLHAQQPRRRSRAVG